MVQFAPPVGARSRHLLPGSEFAASGTGPNDPIRSGAHAGLDFQPEVRGQEEPIHWLVGGTITRIVRSRRQGDKQFSLYDGHTGNAVEWAGDDGRLWHYRHMPGDAMKDLKVGQRVEAGELASRMGTTGNSTGVHLHIGCREKDRFVAPEPILRAHAAWPIGWKITTAEDATTVADESDVDPATHVISEKSLRQIVLKAGYGTKKSTTPFLIRSFQRGQLDPYPLVDDAHWGETTHGQYRWVVALQKAMNAWKGNKTAEDGDWGKVTKARVIELQRRNGHSGGAYWDAGGRVVDGLPGPIFCTMLGISPHPKDR